MRKKPKPVTVLDRLGGGQFLKSVGVRVDGEATEVAVVLRLGRADKRQPNVAVVSWMEPGFKVELFRTKNEEWDGRGEEEVETPHRVAVLLAKYGGGVEGPEPTIPAEVLPPETNQADSAEVAA